MADKRGWWRLEVGDCYPNEFDLENIAYLIRQGYTEGEICKDEEDE